MMRFYINHCPCDIHQSNDVEISVKNFIIIYCFYSYKRMILAAMRWQNKCDSMNNNKITSGYKSMCVVKKYVLLLPISRIWKQVTSVHFFIPSLVHSFIYSFIHLFIRSSVIIMLAYFYYAAYTRMKVNESSTIFDRWSHSQCAVKGMDGG